MRFTKKLLGDFMALETANKKVQEICDQLTKETLEPAQAQAATIVEEAHQQAKALLEKARNEIEQLQKEHESQLQQKTQVHESSIRMALSQAMSALRTKITEQLFSKHLQTLLQEALAPSAVMAALVESIVQGIREKGIDSSLVASVAAGASKEEIDSALVSSVKDELRDHGVELGDFHGGVKVQLVDDNISLEITDSALKDLIMEYISEDLRNMLFTLEG